MMRLFTLTIILFYCSTIGLGQVYTEKQTRHRFAQMNIGADVQVSSGGHTSYWGLGGFPESLELPSLVRPRILIGGTHFWGHADFYIAIPLVNPRISEEGQEIRFSSGVETIFKYYPWRIEHHKVRPFIGLSLAPFNYEQSNTTQAYGDGPYLLHTTLPLLAGATFNSGQHLIDLSLLWNYKRQQDYYISRSTETIIHTPAIYASLSYRYMFETTISAEEDWESGHTEVVTRYLEERKVLNGFYLGVGLSSSFWQGPSTYNEILRPYVMDYPVSIMPDFALGYYIHKPDINVALNFRTYGTSTDAYGVEQKLWRRSIGLEATKFLFDYHGFVPFIGPVVTYEHLSFEEKFEGQPTRDVANDQPGWGITFGWDIRPNRLQTWLLRTNLRWFPDLKLQGEGDAGISFDNVEFNFIQLVVFPGRL